MGHDKVKATPAAKFNPNTIIYDRAKPGEAKRVTEKLFKIFDKDGNGIITDHEIAQVDKLDGITLESMNKDQKAMAKLAKELQDIMAERMGATPIKQCPEKGEPKELPCSVPSPEQTKMSMDIPRSMQKNIHSSLSSWDLQCQDKKCTENSNAQIDVEAAKIRLPINQFKQMLGVIPGEGITKNNAVMALTDKNNLNATKVLLGEKKPPKMPTQTPMQMQNPFGVMPNMRTSNPTPQVEHPSHSTKPTSKYIPLDEIDEGSLVEIPEQKAPSKKSTLIK